ncbi:MAG: DMT family transporter [Candidatus Marinimicrobia bacterium]|nr:DMT family transporter [Candidatus Neomarinimicrobiota bacterium]
MWLFLAIISYFLNSIVSIIDKFIVTKKIGNPLVYAFFVGILSSIAFIVWPFCFSFLSFWVTIFALFGGITFFLAVLFLYKAYRRGGVVRAVSIVGGLSPVLLLALSFVFLHEPKPSFWLLSFALLIAGGLFLAFGQKEKKDQNRNKSKFPFFAIFSAICFALSFFFRKIVFLDTSFLNGFLWVQVGVLLSAVVVWFTFPIRKLVKESTSGVLRKSLVLVVSNKILSAGAFFVLNYSIMLGPVAIINALQGIQYVFLFLLTYLAYLWYPNFVKESFSRRSVCEKIIGIVLISLGVVLLTL